MPSSVTTILFGACDRHNLGDLLFPHIVAALLHGMPVRIAGMAARDLRACGGHRVHALHDLARELGAAPVNLIHVGGEILTCSAADAALMAANGNESRDGQAIAEAPGLAPYVASKRLFANPALFIHNAVGGATLDRADVAMQREVLDSLRTADQITVRDARTQRWLTAQGIGAGLVPDPGVMVAELFGDEIARRQTRGEAAAIHRCLSGGYLAIQFSAEFADDASLAALARQFDRIVDATGFGMAFFRAGAAPLHDDPALYRKVRARMRRQAATAAFESLNIWDICALIAASRGFLGSSLHGRIVALAYALPRVTLALAPSAPGKHSAFVETWDDPAMPGVVPVEAAAEAMSIALRTSPQRSRTTARHLIECYRAGCSGWLRLLAPGGWPDARRRNG